MKDHRGSCLCGAVDYVVLGELRPVIACHCRQCRKTSGHHVAATSALRDDVAITGDVTWFASSDTARRGFCGTCGSPLSYESPVHPDDVDLYAASLEPDVIVEPEFHVYSDEQLPWFEVHDELPRYGGSITSGKPPVRKGVRNS